MLEAENDGVSEKTLTSNAQAKTGEIVNADVNSITSKTERKTASNNAWIIGAGVCLLSGLLY